MMPNICRSLQEAQSVPDIIGYLSLNLGRAKGLIEALIKTINTIDADQADNYPSVTMAKEFLKREVLNG